MTDKLATITVALCWLWQSNVRRFPRGLPELRGTENTEYRIQVHIVRASHRGAGSFHVQIIVNHGGASSLQMETSISHGGASSLHMEISICHGGAGTQHI